MSEYHEQPPDSLITVCIEHSPFVNFAMQQNSVPLVRTLTLENNTTDELAGVGVRIWSDPPVLTERTLRVDAIAPRSSYAFPNVSLALLREPLRKQTEREEGHLWVEVVTDSMQLFKNPFPLTVLAFNEWYGISSLQELVAAHVLPNDPAVERILREASQILKDKMPGLSLSGYQDRDPRHSYSQAAAIYWAVARQKINYINPPASFEDTGQKIRTPEQILARKLGTCMDTTVLLAACFEQAGLRPVVILIEGHAFPGVWLVDKSFDDPVTTHASILLNRVALGEFLVLESTGITATPPTSFKDALDHARGLLQAEARFRYAVDVKAARKIGIRPLSLTQSVTTLSEEDIAGETTAELKREELSAPDSVISAGDEESKQKSRAEESAAGRLHQWKTSLLDLTLRNRLLNYKDTKKAIPILCPDLAGLENALADNEIFRVLPKPDTWGEIDPRDSALHKEQTGEDALTSYLREEMSERRLHAAVGERDLAARLIEIERSSRLGLEEGGANLLFLTLGFLVWTEADMSEIERRAPVLLIPMSIERKSMREGFSLHRIDEESRINITLLQKLKIDFGIEIKGLDPLPEDESGLDVPKILRTIRRAIKRTPRWKVVEEASLSILTFSRFLMWMDLEANAEVLKQNAIVRHLVETPNEPFDPEATFPALETLDDTYSPSNTFCPLHADSSQLRAVFAAAEGRTFVLQGPPGTGKSQTITNLIAHCLTVGKRVLFVAQKRAALDVVHRRVTDVGLGPFCLELHSNKTTKESFRAQLREALGVAVRGSNGHWEVETDRLAQLRRELNEYVRALHQPRAFGKNAYWVITRLIGHEREKKVSLDLGDFSTPTGADYERLQYAVREIVEAVRVSGDPLDHPLGAVRLSEWTYGIEDEIGDALGKAAKAHNDLRTSALPVFEHLEFGLDEASLSEFKAAGELTSLLEHGPDVTRAILTEPDWPSLEAELTKWIELGRECAQKRSKLLEVYKEEFFSLQFSDLVDKLALRKKVRFYRRWRIGSFVRKAVRVVRIDGKKPKDLASLEQDLGEGLTVLEELAKLEDRAKSNSRFFGSLWKGLDTDWDHLQRIIEWVGLFLGIVARANIANTADPKTIEAWISLATENRSIFAAGSPAAKQAQLFRNAIKDVETSRVHLGNLLRLDDQMAWGKEDDRRMLERADSTLRNLSDNLSVLRQWSHYQSSRSAAVSLHLAKLVEALEKGQVKIHELESVFEYSFADWWARNVLKSVPCLSGFVGERHNLKINDYRKLGRKIEGLTRKEVFARIASGLPRIIGPGQRTPASSETGMLQRFAQGGRKTIRRIFKECPNALAKYKPCVLMSPLSVAQFIGTDFPKFDLVVFDEASQMPTYEAVGAIARGNQLIVVGDSRQLPPTTFFERQKGDEEYSETDLPEELESILEEAEAAGIRPLRLDWHYRSRHESLIAFSNRQYYENRLHTFPAAVAEHPRLGVSLRRVPEGVYDHGRSRTNHKEAEAVVSEIVRRLRNPMEQGDSLGVVTFSISQQRLVEDLLDAAREEYPEIEPYFAIDEPVFIKNLETVQGDERDVILFSICYGPDAAGVVRMNFGPLNNKGGERRLNVAITRARKQLLVFSTIGPDQIDISRTQAVGVHHLRTFLDYANRGPTALAGELKSSQGEVESPFEQSVYDELIKRGWIVDKQVGCSGYRIDLAVRDPDKSGRYLLGIECDGAHYHSAKSARDRDRIRQVVLEGLGWRLHRIWSTDWWLQRKREIAKLEEELNRSKLKARALMEEDLDPPVSLRPKQTPIMEPELQSQTLSGAGVPLNATSHEQKLSDSGSDTEGLPGQSAYKYYVPMKKALVGELHDPSNAKTVREIVIGIARVEAPILFDSICREVASCWGLQRAGKRVREVVKKAVKQNGLVFRRSGKREFVWTNELAGKPYEGFRVPGKDDSRLRQAQEICPEEIANAAYQVLKQHLSMDIKDLSRETANVFGIRRLGPKVRVFFEEGVTFLAKQSRCRIEGSTAIFVS